MSSATINVPQEQLDKQWTIEKYVIKPYAPNLFHHTSYTLDIVYKHKNQDLYTLQSVSIIIVEDTIGLQVLNIRDNRPCNLDIKKALGLMTKQRILEDALLGNPTALYIRNHQELYEALQ